MKGRLACCLALAHILSFSLAKFGPGQVYHEAVNTTMQARNPNAAQRTELILFQVGGKGEPLMLRGKPPGR